MTRHAETPVGDRRDPWVALDSSADPKRSAIALRDLHERVVSGGPPSRALRPTIAASWRRSAERGVSPSGTGAPHRLGGAALEERRRTHPLAAALPAIRGVLHAAMTEAHHIMVVSDEHGVLLWVEGPAREISRAADDMNFVPGSDWSESGVGTNSIGTALAADHAIQVFSAEHFNTACHRWTCSGAPVHDPVTGQILGAIDITSNLSMYHPNGHPLVLAAARVAEGVLAEQARRRDQELVDLYLGQLGSKMRPPSAIATADGRVLASFPTGWLGSRTWAFPPGGGEMPRHGVEAAPVLDGRGFVIRPLGARRGRRPGGIESSGLPTLDIRARGRRGARCRLWGREVELSPRHSEILVLLALHPEGLTGQEIAAALYTEAVTPVTIRAEVSRLRALLGDVIGSRPYRLEAQVRADFLPAPAALESDADGLLLVGSAVPEIVDLRARLSS